MQPIDFKVKMLNDLLPYFRGSEDIDINIEAIAEQFDNVEDAIFYLLESLNIRQARGVWLDYVGSEVGADRDELIRDDRFFQINSEDINDEKLFYNSQTSSALRPISLDDQAYLQKILAKIGENTTSATRNENLRIIKLLADAEQVFIRRIDTMTLEVILIGRDIILNINTKNNIENVISDGVQAEPVKFSNTDLSDVFMLNTENINVEKAFVSTLEV